MYFCFFHYHQLSLWLFCPFHCSPIYSPPNLCHFYYWRCAATTALYFRYLGITCRITDSRIRFLHTIYSSSTSIVNLKTMIANAETGNNGCPIHDSCPFSHGTIKEPITSYSANLATIYLCSRFSLKSVCSFIVLDYLFQQETSECFSWQQRCFVNLRK